MDKILKLHQQEKLAGQSKPQTVEEIAKALPASAWKRLCFREGTKGTQQVQWIVMLAAWAGFRVLGVIGLLPDADSWSSALRFRLACMFLLTALAHFLPRTWPDLVRSPFIFRL